MDHPSSIFFPAKTRKRRRRRVEGSAAVTGPVLVAASFDAPSGLLTLTFDRPVNVTGGFLVAEAITVLDGPNDAEYVNAPEVDGAGTTTLTVTMFGNAPFEGSGVTMTCGEGTGVVSAGDGEPWTGVADVVLPFP